MCKAAKVQVINQVQIGGAYMTTLIRGDVGSVRAAVDAGAQVASQTGELVSAHIIPRPEQAIIDAVRASKATRGRRMNILVANIGSTSFKYRLYRDAGREAAGARRRRTDRLGEHALVRRCRRRSRRRRIAPVPDHAAAVSACLKQLTDREVGCLKDRRRNWRRSASRRSMRRA